MLIIHYVRTSIRPLSDSGDTETVKKLEKLETLVKSQEKRIRALETGPQEGVGLEGESLADTDANVMEYIEKHPNVTKQDVVDHFKGEMARVPVFKTIDRLVRYGIIDDNLDPKNRQVHRLSLNKNSIFYSVLQELFHFHNSFLKLLEKIQQRDKEKDEKMFPPTPEILSEFLEIMAQAHLVLDDMLKSYIVRYTEVWPQKFQGRKDVVNKLLAIVLNEVTMLRDYLPRIPVENIDYVKDALLIAKLQGTEQLKSYVTEAEKFGLTKEMEPVLDSLWEVNKEIQAYAYPEPRLYSWKEFEYYKDDWRKLLDLTKKHPDQTLFKLKIPTAGLLNKPIELLLK